MQRKGRLSASGSNIIGHRNAASVLGLFVLLILAGTSLASCPDNAVLAAVKQQVNNSGSSGVSHVYIAGEVGPSNSSTVPVYWKDGNLNYLPLSGGMTNGWADNMRVDSEGNIYVLGGQWNSTTTVYGYWKNSVFFTLSLGSYSVFWDNCIAVDTKGNVWIAGSAGNSSPPTTPVFWENEVGPTILPGVNVTDVWNAGVDASGNVYFTGTTGGTSSNVATPTKTWTPVYWINAANPTALPLSGVNTYGAPHQNTLDTSGNLYLAGDEWSATTSTVPVYWKAVSGIWGSPTSLQLGAYTGSTYCAVQGIAVSSSGSIDVFANIGLTSPTTLIYWKGATSSPNVASLGGNTYFTAYYSAVDAQGNFFFAGSVGSSSSTTIPVYWENGNLFQLPMGSGNTFGRADEIVIVQ